MVADPRFAERVGRVFTEYGTRSQQAYLASFMAAPALSEGQVAERARYLLRNPDVWPVWTNTNFYTTATAPIAGGAWDAAFSRLGNPPLGFDLAGSPFGDDGFDLVAPGLLIGLAACVLRRP